MTEIRSNTLGMGGAYTPASTESVEALAANLPGATTVDSVKMLSELGKLAATFQASSPQGTAGVSNANGAPLIDGVQINFSPEDLAVALTVLQGKTQEAQLTTAKEGLSTSKKKLEEKNQQAMEKINKWISDCQKAASKAKVAGIFGWVTKIAGFIAAAVAVVVAAVATAASVGGASALLALAVVGLVGATISLASQISQAAGGPALELSALLSKLCTGMLEAIGVPKDKAEQAGKMMSGMMGIMSGAVLVDPAFGGQAFGGFAELVGANATQAAIVSGVFTAVATIGVAVVMVVASGGTNVSGAVNGMAKLVQTGAKIAQSAAGAAAGGAAAVQGGLKIAQAHDERSGALAQADKKLIDAMILKLQKSMEDDREDVKKVIQEMMDGLNIVSQMIAGASNSRMQIASNMSGKGQTI